MSAGNAANCRKTEVCIFLKQQDDYDSQKRFAAVAARCYFDMQGRLYFIVWQFKLQIDLHCQ